MYVLLVAIKATFQVIVYHDLINFSTKSLRAIALFTPLQEYLSTNQQKLTKENYLSLANRL